MTLEITLPKWYDLHTHFRQGDSLKSYVQAHIDMGCAGALAMPNTKPPTAKVLESDAGDSWSIEAYKNMIELAAEGQFKKVIVPLYLTQKATPEIIEQGKKSGLLEACKYYPPHGTTGAESAAPLEHYIDNGVFKAMEDNNVTLCIHGEEHDLCAEHYFDRKTNAEESFYQKHMTMLRDKYPNLKIVCEHITTKVAADFVTESGNNIAATITPQHLLYTIGHLIQGLRYHLFCLPVVKHEEDRDALRKAATNANNTKFFAGTDSAPHTTKATDCGCAAGCFTGGIAPQIYAKAFEESGIDLSTASGQNTFKNFLCLNGANFYGLEIPTEAFKLIKKETPVNVLKAPDGDVIPLPLGMKKETISWALDNG